MKSFYFKRKCGKEVSKKHRDKIVRKISDTERVEMNPIEIYISLDDDNDDDNDNFITFVMFSLVLPFNVKKSDRP